MNRSDSMKCKHLIRNMLFIRVIESMEHRIQYMAEENAKVLFIDRISSRAMKHVNRLDILRMRVKSACQRAVSIEW